MPLRELVLPQEDVRLDVKDIPIRGPESGAWGVDDQGVIVLETHEPGRDELAEVLFHLPAATLFSDPGLPKLKSELEAAHQEQRLKVILQVADEAIEKFRQSVHAALGIDEKEDLMAHVRRHPKRGRWQVRCRDPSGRERSKTFIRKTDADRFAATATADVLRGECIDHQLGKTTVGELANRWQQTRRHLARATQDQDRHVLGSLVLPVFRTRAVASVKPSEIAGWLAGLTLAPATKSKALQKFSAVMAMAVADGAIRSNPCDPVSRPSQRPLREGRALSDAAMAAADEVARRAEAR